MIADISPVDPNAPKRVLKFPSDVSLSVHPRVQDEWKEFAGPGGQDHWNDDFAKEMIRLGFLGVNNINNMTECTKVLPPATGRFFRAFDQSIVNPAETSTAISTSPSFTSRLIYG